MSPDRTSPATSLPVRSDRAPRGDQAPASDAFATLLGAHADRADRAPSRRERQPSDDGPRDRRPVDRPARPDRPADVRDRSKPAPAADHPTSEPATTDEPAPADNAAATAAASAMLGLLAAVAPQQPTPAPTAPTAEPTPVVEEPTVAAPVAAVLPQTAAAAEAAAPEPQAAPSQEAGSKAVPTQAAPAPVAVEGAEPAGIEGDKNEAPASPALATEVATPSAEQTSVAGRASVADSGNTQAGDRRSEAVSGAGAEARPSAEAPVSEQPAAQSGEQKQSDQRQGDAPRTAAQAAQPAAQAPTQRVDVTPITAPAVHQAAEPKGAATLSQAPRAVGQLIHLASQRGVQHARLNLKPVELGGIEIRLQTSSAGVTAQVVADSPEAARLLQQAGDDLKRSLAASNVELLSLDVSTSSDQERRDAGAASGSFEQFDQTGPRGNDGPGRHQRAGEADTDLSHSTQETVLELPDGVLVDVLA
jgi:flagellar hook-length control protein FliK